MRYFSVELYGYFFYLKSLVKLFYCFYLYIFLNKKIVFMKDVNINLSCIDLNRYIGCWRIMKLPTACLFRDQLSTIIIYAIAPKTNWIL